MKKIILGLCCLLSILTLKAQSTINVSSITQLKNAINAAVPGDNIIVANGVYTTISDITISKQGTSSKPITIQAQTVGGVEIQGIGGFQVKSPAAYIIIKGFKLTYNTGETNIQPGSTHITFTRNIVECAAAGTGNKPYLVVSGDDSEISYNTFQNKNTEGCMVTVQGPGYTAMSQNVWIHHNLFNNFKSSGANNSSAIQVGISGRSMSSANAIVEHNVFMDCNGENEGIVSNKASDVTYRYNTIIRGRELSIRHGNRMKAYGNYFFNSDGLRFSADDHVICNNYFEGCNQAIICTSGDGEVADGDGLAVHDRPDRVKVIFNTMVNNVVNYRMPFRSGGLGAKNITFANNIIQGGNPPQYLGSYTNPVWEGNLLYNVTGGSIPASGYQTVDPKLAEDASSVFKLQSGSPAINASKGSYTTYLTDDMDGQSRTGIYDVGADEYSTVSTNNPVLGTSDVGAYAGTKAPTVSITSPVNNAVIAPPANININASASDADGTVSKVDFYNGTTLLASDNTSPYSYSWNNVSSGTYNITAKATDNNGLTTTSAVVKVIVNTLPTVSIISPVNNAVYTSGSSVTINANASDADGTVAKVEFFIDGAKLGEDASSPYSINWTSTAGVHWIKAIATDNYGAKSNSDSISVIVRGPYGGTAWPIPGKIEAENYDIGGQGISYNDLTTGNLGNVYRTDDIDITATNDVGGGYHIYYVQARDWMEYSVNVNTAGTYILQVRVAATAIGKTFHVEMDGQNISGAISIPNTGSYQTFQTVSVTTTPLTIGKKILRIVMDSPNFNLNYVAFALNQSPTVTITAPLEGATFISGNSITINATASDPDGSISKVEYYLDGTTIGEDATSPYTFTWTATTGTHSITTVATDNSGSKTTSTAISIIVDSPNQLPDVSITSPTIGTIYKLGDIVTINSTATDADGTVAKVEFFAGGIKIGEDLTSPYSFSWSSGSSGTNILTARATDNKGAVKTSSEISVTIDTPPTVSVTSPANNAGFNEGDVVSITGNAADADGSLHRVEFYIDGVKIGEDSISPYGLTWVATAGTHSLTLKAIDDLGISTSSSVVSIKVNKAPFLSITSPVDGTEFIEGESVSISANASDADGSIASVEFFINGVSIGKDATSPYTMNWTSIKGAQLITAMATDNSGKISSDSLTINVYANEVPEGNIISPSDQSTYNPGSVVSIEADASDVDGNVTKVEFYIDDNKIGEDLSAPYTISWTSIVGTHNIKAIATDNLGASSAYSLVSLIVKAPNQDPIVSITSPSNGTIFQTGDVITINATASDIDGTIKKVEFFVDNVKIGEDVTSPYSFTWTTSTEGTYTITAQASDDKGAVTVSSDVNIIIDAPPSISISLPGSGGSNYTQGEDILIAGLASDVDGSIVKVEFFVDGIKVGEDMSSPYSFFWTATEGTHTLMAKATDNLGIVSSSSILSLTVDNIPTGINKGFGMQPSSLTIYPNPTSDEVNVVLNSDYSGKGSLLLYDELGNELAILANGYINSNSLQFNLQELGLKAGVFMIKIINDSEVKTVKFIKE